MSRWFRNVAIWFLEDELSHLGSREIIADARFREEKARGNADLALHHFGRLTKIRHRKERVHQQIVQLSARRFAHTERG